MNDVGICHVNLTQVGSIFDNISSINDCVTGVFSADLRNLRYASISLTIVSAISVTICNSTVMNALVIRKKINNDIDFLRG